MKEIWNAADHVNKDKKDLEVEVFKEIEIKKAHAKRPSTAGLIDGSVTVDRRLYIKGKILH